MRADEQQKGIRVSCSLLDVELKYHDNRDEDDLDKNCDPIVFSIRAITFSKPLLQHFSKSRNVQLCIFSIYLSRFW